MGALSCRSGRALERPFSGEGKVCPNAHMGANRSFVDRNRDAATILFVLEINHAGA